MKSIQDKIKKVTVKFLKKGGRGTLVNNRFILTASHVVNAPNDGSVVLGEWYLEKIETEHNEIVGVHIIVEIVNDIAVIGPPDDQELYQEYKKYEMYCVNAPHIRLSYPNINSNAYFLNQNNRWIGGKIKGVADAGFFIEFSENILWGDSGSGIFNEEGKLIGIISNAGGTEGKIFEGRAPIIERTLPIYVLARLKERFNPEENIFYGSP